MANSLCEKPNAIAKTVRCVIFFQFYTFILFEYYIIFYYINISVI